MVDFLIYRSSVSPKIVEDLIFIQQWLRPPSKECKLEDILEGIQRIKKIEELYIFKLLLNMLYFLILLSIEFVSILS